MKLNDKLMILMYQAAEKCTVDEDILTKKESPQYGFRKIKLMYRKY